MILGMEAWLFWLILAAVFIIVEMATVNLVSIWFVGGCIVGCLAALLGASVTLQVILSVVISGVLLTLVLIFRPFDKLKKQTVVPTNYDKVIGQTAVVTHTIDNRQGMGQVNVMGQIWSAISEDAQVIEPGKSVLVKAVTGVKLVVFFEEGKEQNP